MTSEEVRTIAILLDAIDAKAIPNIDNLDYRKEVETARNLWSKKWQENLPTTQYKYTGLGNTLIFAASLGWKETLVGDWNPDAVDALEEDAIEFIEAKGIKVIYP